MELLKAASEVLTILCAMMTYNNHLKVCDVERKSRCLDGA